LKERREKKGDMKGRRDGGREGGMEGGKERRKEKERKEGRVLVSVVGVCVCVCVCVEREKERFHLQSTWILQNTPITQWHSSLLPLSIFFVVVVCLSALWP
jgi:hypothetical protein